ncbi:hypothetical protein B5807_10206 [Epicoccum nigrum]|uniref:Uncharacterized protein n=1 Tax=Epicoccum nigrum TaxID=105696 RepID=A0A1Y2LRG6_EPING|nr:hypothetical protein B5807_10206 [Epicoccum nigrum]
MANGTSRNAKGKSKAAQPPYRSSLRPKFTQYPRAESAEGCRLTILRAEKQRDHILVNSIEQDPCKTPPLTGFKHYMYMMQMAGLDSILAQDEVDTPSDAQQNGTLNNDTLNHHSTTPSSTHPTHRFAPTPLSAPTSPPCQTQYDHPIYTGTTYNPAVFLAILGIGSANLPNLSLLSALNHIPNVHPADPLPVLRPAAPGNMAPRPFLDSTFAWEEKEGDEEVSVAFLPNFYSRGEMHAIGFWTTREGGEGLLGQKMLGAAFVTPCCEEELAAWGLLEYAEEEEGEGRLLRRVGCRAGRWVERDTVEEYEEWKMAFSVAGKAWEGRVGLAKGGLECPG